MVNRLILTVVCFLSLWCIINATLSSAYGDRAPSRCGMDRARLKDKSLKPIDPEKVAREMKEMEEKASAHHRRGDNPVYIPINYHILTNVDNEGEMDNLLLYHQTYVLNQALNPHGYYFYTKLITRTLNTMWTSDCETNAAAIGAALAVNPASEMNVYSCVNVGTTDEGGSILGFTYLPEDYPAADTRNGVYVWYRTFPNGGAPYYSQGDTLVHETGHYIGLLHTFEGGCSVPNDGVADTPACEANVDISCPDDRDTCPGLPGDDDVRNFMDYSIDSCLDHFTTGQEARIDLQVAQYKPLLLANSENHDAPMDFPSFDPDPNSASGLMNWLRLLL